MERAKLSFIKSLAHIEVWPTGGYQQYVPKSNVSERLNDHWTQVGKYLSRALVQYEVQQAKQK
ncbi:hypothetical protein [Thiomicrospira microaerophila]|jgi:hypothetical protein|uniref:hypothetical protein n=1 Tax=Thiomicrospira microaerophila TaxID=406020 RepID=UPI0005C9F135|nr:hypothetical protein [Thiomicrospira microaerophila]